MGRLAIEVGTVTDHVCERSGWADLTILRLAYPPPQAPLARLGSGVRNLLRCCRSPLLVTPGTPAAALDRVLVAYDGSPKAEQALFVAAYLAVRWGSSLAVVSVGESRSNAEAILAWGAPHPRRARRTRPRADPHAWTSHRPVGESPSRRSKALVDRRPRASLRWKATSTSTLLHGPGGGTCFRRPPERPERDSRTQASAMRLCACAPTLATSETFHGERALSHDAPGGIPGTSVCAFAPP